MNYTGQNNYASTVYLVEQTDPVIGGQGGITNTGIKALADRTAFLKSALEDIQKMLNAMRIIKSGEYKVTNKFVRYGFIASNSSQRKLAITRTGTYSLSNVSCCYMHNKNVKFQDRNDLLTVPTNTTTENRRYFVYLYENQEGYIVALATSVPSGALVLYTILVPAGDTEANSLHNCVITSMFTAANNNPTFYKPGNEIQISFDEPLETDDYIVQIGVKSVTDFGFAGEFQISWQTVNGFSIIYTGPADDMIITWDVMVREV